MQVKRVSTRSSPSQKAKISSTKRQEKASQKQSTRTKRVIGQGKTATASKAKNEVDARNNQIPIVNVNVGSHANLQIVDLSTKVNIQSHSEEVLFEQTKTAYLANPRAFINNLGNPENKQLNRLIQQSYPQLRLMRKNTFQPGMHMTNRVDTPVKKQRGTDDNDVEVMTMDLQQPSVVSTATQEHQPQQKYPAAATKKQQQSKIVSSQEPMAPIGRRSTSKASAAISSSTRGKADLAAASKKQQNLDELSKELIGKESLPVSGSNFMINLSPILRRAQTAFVNFDQKPEVAAAANEDSKAKKAVLEQQKMEISTRRSKSKAQKAAAKRQVIANEMDDNVYRPTSRWNDVISDKEIQKLVNATCQNKTCRDRHSQQVPGVPPGQELQRYLSFHGHGGTSSRPGVGEITDPFELQKMNVLPGLYNMGNTCFANSVLQCLVHTRVFREYCRLSKHSKNCFSDISKEKFVETVDEFPVEKLERIPVIQNVMSKRSTFCSFCIMESHIKSILEAKKNGNMQVRPIGIYLLFQHIGNGAFQLGQQSDAQEFLFCLLDNLTQASFGYLRRVPFSYEKITFVPQVFQGQLERQIICGSCYHTYSRREDFLSLTLTMVLNQQKEGSHNIDYNKVNFFDCLADYFKSTTLDTDNLRRCEFCARENQAILQYRMKTLPRILVIQMKRFDQFERKLANNVSFPFTFSFDKNYLNSELCDKEINGYQYETAAPPFYQSSNPLLPRIGDENPTIKRRHTYELYAMIIHHGYSARRGHYYSLIRHGNTGKWIKFDDEKITLIDQVDKLLLLAQKAYILFYEKKWIFEDNQQGEQLQRRKSVRLNNMNDEQPVGNANTSGKKSVVKINVKVDQKPQQQINSNQQQNKKSSAAQTAKQISVQMQRDLDNFDSKNSKKKADSSASAALGGVKRRAKQSTEKLLARTTSTSRDPSKRVRQQQSTSTTATAQSSRSRQKSPSLKTNRTTTTTKAASSPATVRKLKAKNNKRK